MAFALLLLLYPFPRVGRACACSSRGGRAEDVRDAQPVRETRLQYYIVNGGFDLVNKNIESIELTTLEG